MENILSLGETELYKGGSNQLEKKPKTMDRERTHQSQEKCGERIPGLADQIKLCKKGNGNKKQGIREKM